MISIIFGLITSLAYAFLAPVISIPVLLAIFVFSASWYLFLSYTIVLVAVLKVIAEDPKLETDLKSALAKKLL